MRLGPPTVDNYQVDYSMYIDGFRYALYATMAASESTANHSTVSDSGLV